MGEQGVPVLPRSFLYVPGFREELLEKATRESADAIVLDLEDAVPVGDKDNARRLASDWLRPTACATSDMSQPVEPARWVRINADAIAADLEAVVHPGLAGVFLAKCSRSGLGDTAAALDALEDSRGLTAGSVRVVGLLESASTMADLAAVTLTRRLTTLGIGEVDLLADLRIRRTIDSEAAVDALRSQVVLHCAAAGLTAPVGPTSTSFRDLEGLADSTRHLYNLGFRSRTAIHPVQLSVIHDLLTPDEEAVARARDVVARFEATSGGITTDEGGQLIDAAVVREAREILARATRE